MALCLIVDEDESKGAKHSIHSSKIDDQKHGIIPYLCIVLIDVNGTCIIPYDE